MHPDLTRHIRRFGATAAGIAYVERAEMAPTRLVGKTRHLSVSTRFASPKMGVVLQAESHTCELPFLHACELRTDVLAIYDQPPQLFIEQTDRRGRLRRDAITPDFLVIASEEVVIYECKTGAKLRELVNERPCSWTLDTAGYRFLPGEQAAGALGFRFAVHNADSISAIHAANLRLLVNLKRSGVSPLDERQLAKATLWLQRRHAMTIDDLADRLRLQDVSPLLATVQAGQLHVLLKWQLLSDFLHTLVYATSEHAALAEQAMIVAAELDPLRPQNFKAPIAFSPKALSKACIAVERIRLIQAGKLAPNRTDYRQLAKLNKGTASGKTAMESVTPAYHLRGTHARLSAESKAVVAECIDAYWTAMHPKITEVHRSTRARFSAIGQPAPCYETIRQAVHEATTHKRTRQREGHRAANAGMAPIPATQAAIPASYAWERAHIDSTDLDEKVWLGSRLNRILVRPKLYLLIDEATSYILAFWLCFSHAGRQAVACLLRDCIRRHQKLPCCVVHDLGSEYLSVFHEAFYATQSIDLQRRPSGAPRWGSHVESAFNRINSLIVHRLPGNTQNDRLGRGATRDVRSQAHARHDVSELLQILEKDFMGWLNQRPVEGQIGTPQANFDASSARFDSIARSVPLTSETLAQSAIPVPALHRIDQAHGIRYMHRWYIGDAIRDPRLHGQKVSIRWEPYNPSVIYANINRHWERLVTRDYVRFENAGHLAQMTELYLRFDVPRSGWALRQEVDMVHASQISQNRVAQDPPAHIPPTDGNASAKPKAEDKDPFADARCIDDALLAQEADHVD